MKIGIIVHSLSGNTMGVAERLKERLQSDGHAVQIERLETVGEESIKEVNSQNITLKAYPDPTAYDLVIFAGPVRGASTSPLLQHYFSRMGQLANKRVLLFVTEFFPFPWMGGKRAIKQLTRMCEEHGATVLNTGVINWKNPHREGQITELLQSFSETIAKQG